MLSYYFGTTTSTNKSHIQINKPIKSVLVWIYHKQIMNIKILNIKYFTIESQ